jgi:hypothetical protein
MEGDRLCANGVLPPNVTPEDAILIHHGLEGRHARLAPNGFAGATVNHSYEIGPAR